jgi:5-methylcytosine-specific restriction endonuclease McrA
MGCWLEAHKAVYIDRICLCCGKKFKVREKRVSDGRGKYCTKECYSKSMKSKNKKTRREINKDYRKTHQGKSAEWKHKRRALKAMVGGYFSADEWKILVLKTGGFCPDCGEKRKFTVDHIIPLTKWLEWKKKNKPDYKWNDIQNIQPLCGSCNSRKNNYLVGPDHRIIVSK